MSVRAVKVLIAAVLVLSAVPPALLLRGMGFELFVPVSWYRVGDAYLEGRIELPLWFLLSWVWVTVSSLFAATFLMSAAMPGSRDGGERRIVLEGHPERNAGRKSGNRKGRSKKVAASDGNRGGNAIESGEVSATTDRADGKANEGRFEKIASVWGERFRPIAVMAGRLLGRAAVGAARFVVTYSVIAMRSLIKVTKLVVLMIRDVIAVMAERGKDFGRKRRKIGFTLGERLRIFFSDMKRMFSEDEYGVGADPSEKRGGEVRERSEGLMARIGRIGRKEGEGTDDGDGDEEGFRASGEESRARKLRTSEGSEDDDDENDFEETVRNLFSWYAVWTRTLPSSRTDAMREEGRDIRRKLDERRIGRIFEEYGMRGQGAVQALKAAVGEERGERTSNARPLPEPEEEEILETSRRGREERNRESPAVASTSATEPERGDGISGSDGWRKEDGTSSEDPEDGDLYDAVDGIDVREDKVHEADGFMEGLGLDEDGKVEDGPTENEGGDPDETADGEPREEDIPLGIMNIDYGNDRIDETVDGEWSSEAADVMDDLGAEGDESDGEAGEDVDFERMVRAARNVKRGEEGGSLAEEDWKDHALNVDEDETVEGSEIEASVTVPAEEIEERIRGMGREGLRRVVGENETRNDGGAREVSSVGEISDLIERDPMAAALWNQVRRMTEFQGQAYAWERLGEEPPEEFDTDAKRRDFIVKVSGAIVGLREQIDEEVLEELKRRKDGSEEVRWIEGRADAVMQSALRDESGGETRAVMGFKRVDDDNRFMDYEIREAWRLTAPIVREYRELAAALGVKSFRSVQINPMPSGEERDDLFDMIDLIIGEQRGFEREDGGRIRAAGIAFVIVPEGEWHLREIKRQNDWDEGYALVPGSGEESMIRMRDRSLRIFDMWADSRGMSTIRVCHVVLLDGAVVEGMSDPERVADALQTMFGDMDDVGCEVRTRPWSRNEWADHVAPFVKP